MTIKTDFDIEDEVYYMEDNKVATSVVKSISIYIEDDSMFGITKTTVFYKILDGTMINGKALFSSKEDLLESL